MRYYGALMTSKLLPEGTIDYNKLSDLCMIVIAGFDMGGEGKYRYKVRRMYGRAAEKMEMAKAMKIKNYPDDEIAEPTGLSPRDIKAL